MDEFETRSYLAKVTSKKRPNRFLYALIAIVGCCVATAVYFIYFPTFTTTIPNCDSPVATNILKHAIKKNGLNGQHIEIQNVSKIKTLDSGDGFVKCLAQLDHMNGTAYIAYVFKKGEHGVYIQYEEDDGAALLYAILDAKKAIGSLSSPVATDSQRPLTLPNETSVSNPAEAGPSNEAHFSDDLNFSDYGAAVYSGPAKYPDLTGSQKSYASFRTRIRDSVKGGINFAGTMSLTSFGCGTECLMGFATNLETGVIYDLPVSGEEYRMLNFHFRPNSSLLLAEWAATSDKDQDICIHAFYQWAGEEFKLLQKREILGYCPEIE